MTYPILKMKHQLKNSLSVIGGILVFSTSGNIAQAQSMYKEASNNFARYTQSGELKHLESAKKFVDDGYKTRRDSSNSRMNIMRSMVYSSIAYADSTKKINTPSDPIDIAINALKQVRPNDLDSYENEQSYINQNIAAAYTYRANKALSEGKKDEALNLFLKVRALQPTNDLVVQNIAMLANATGKNDIAIEYYEKAITLESREPSHYLALASVYARTNKKQQELKTLEAGRMIFPDDKEILFRLIQVYTENRSYDAILPIIDEAIAHEPENVQLNYLAGYTYENAKNVEKAKQFYEKTVALDNNNYEANLALGLIHLEKLLKNREDYDAQANAEDYLLKANEIKPFEVHALKSLAILYEAVEDDIQLDRVNMLLNRIEADS